jgi:hypothetical protein
MAFLAMIPGHALAAQVAESSDRAGASSARIQRVWVYNDLPESGAGSEWQLVEELRLGRAEGSGADIFADIHDIAVDDRRRIYVFDAGWGEIRVFDRDGRYLSRMANEGDGPGEMRHAAAVGSGRVVWQPPNRLWIGNHRQLLALDTLGNELGRSTRGSVRSTAPSFRSAPFGGVVYADTLGFVYQKIRVLAPRDRPAETSYLYVSRNRVSAAAEILPGDTMLVETRPLSPDGPPVTTREGRSSISLSMVRPVPARIVWAPDPGGTVWLAHRSARRFHEVTFAGDTVRTIELGTPPLPASNRGEEFRPVLASLNVSPEGWLWARLEPEGGDADETTTWDLFDNCGRHRGFVTLDERVAVFATGAGGRVYAVVPDTLGVDYVLGLRLAGTDGSAVAVETCAA